MDTYPVGLRKEELDTPVLCLDIDALDKNIEKMAGYFAERPASLRPHTKTHKCPLIAQMQLRAGAIGVTCAKLGEAEAMAQAGIRDILIANQIIGPRKITRLVNLAAYTDVMVAVEDETNALALSEAAQTKGVELRVLVEVDVGMGRCGTAPEEPSLRLAKRLVSLSGLRFEGIMGYEGHAVMIEDFQEREKAAQEAMAKLIATRDFIEERGIEVKIVSGGGTGTYQITGNYPGVTEVQVGSYATMDARYRSVGIDFHQALTVVTQVISTRGTDHAITDAGMKTVTPEFGMPRVLDPKGWKVTKLAEEHGFLQRENGRPLRPGDTVELIPSHGCTTINLHDAYYVTRDGIVEAVWPIAARGAIR
ncbi:MAG: DSD1 family PLP-dependent enzyme [Chloroflexota bacterium]|nr:DSD1 family PLP-dependent enzyme [Chloroflexota bacterium]